tara:strand:+ start:3180 stop:4058 length:879 start_codon:yes stop_codon:yes gene_type:complete
MKKKVIVFGGSGFLGSNVSDFLTKKNYDVTIFDKEESKYLKSGQKMIIGDINDIDLVNKSIKGNKVVYNFAAISDIDECRSKPIETIKYNILRNAEILESAIKNNVERFLFASSAYVYSSAGSFYKISKQASEQLIESFTLNEKTNYTILRYGSLYGDRSDGKNSLYRLLSQAISDNKMDYYGDGNETREFIHVKDAAELSVKAISKEYENQILMLTGSKSIKYIDLLEMISEIMNSKIKIEIHPNKSKEHYKMSPYSFNPKMAKKLTLNPHIDLGQGLLNLISDIYEKDNL